MAKEPAMMRAQSMGRQSLPTVAELGGFQRTAELADGWGLASVFKTSWFLDWAAVTGINIAGIEVEETDVFICWQGQDSGDGGQSSSFLINGERKRHCKVFARNLSSAGIKASPSRAFIGSCCILDCCNS